MQRAEKWRQIFWREFPRSTPAMTTYSKPARNEFVSTPATDGKCTIYLEISPGRKRSAYNQRMEKKVFWMVFFSLGLLADFLLPLWWGVAATIPIVFIAWWVAYRSDWF